jgi:6-phosphogluconolactonase (cycloisomerase 2 family)
MKIKILLCMILCSTINLLAQNNFIYTNDDVSPNTVSAFRVNADGSLTLLPGSPFATGGNGGNDRTIDPEKITTARVAGRGFLYAANIADGTVSGFRINPQTGALVAVPGLPVPIGAVNSSPALASSPNGKFLFATDDFTPVVHVFRIARATGSLREVPGSPFNVGDRSQRLKVSPSGQFLAVGLESINAVGIFAIGDDGTLTPAPGSPVLSSATPTAIDINCHNNRVFVAVSDGFSSHIDVFHMAEDGSLTPAPGSPFPSGARFNVSALTLSPNNEFLFTSNTFDEAVSSLAVEANGALKPVSGSPFAAADFVGKIETTRAGDFVYASLFASAAVDGWSVGPNGTLARVPGSPFRTGQSPVTESSMVVFPPSSCRAAELDGDEKETKERRQER